MPLKNRLVQPSGPASVERLEDQSVGACVLVSSERKQRENLEAGDDVLRVLRGGAFDYDEWDIRCACRLGNYPSFRFRNYGFRVVASLVPSSP